VLYVGPPGTRKVQGTDPKDQSARKAPARSWLRSGVQPEGRPRAGARSGLPRGDGDPPSRARLSRMVREGLAGWRWARCAEPGSPGGGPQEETHSAAPLVFDGSGRDRSFRQRVDGSAKAPSSCARAGPEWSSRLACAPRRFGKFFFRTLPAAWVGAMRNQGLRPRSPTRQTPFGRVPTGRTGTERAQRQVGDDDAKAGREAGREDSLPP
jgi:hypothetical protein